MTAIRYYTCTQEREVKVAAHSAIEAALVASIAFRNNQSIEGVDIRIPETGTHGHTTTLVRIRDIVAREDYS